MEWECWCQRQCAPPCARLWIWFNWQTLIRIFIVGLACMSTVNVHVNGKFKSNCSKSKTAMWIVRWRLCTNSTCEINTCFPRHTLLSLQDVMFFTHPTSVPQRQKLQEQWQWSYDYCSNGNQQSTSIKGKYNGFNYENDWMEFSQYCLAGLSKRGDIIFHIRQHRYNDESVSDNNGHTTIAGTTINFCLVSATETLSVSTCKLNDLTQSYLFIDRRVRRYKPTTSWTFQICL